MPLASVTAHWLAGWGSVPVGSGGAGVRPRYQPQPIKKVRRTVTSTVYASAAAVTGKRVRAAAEPAPWTASSSSTLEVTRRFTPTAAAAAHAHAPSKRIATVLASPAAELGHVTIARIPVTERAERRRFAQTQLLVVIIDEDSR